MQPLPNFRDFYPEDCLRRNYVLHHWRETARRYGFVEYDGPTVESVELYRKKSGGELLGQLFTVGNTRAEEGDSGALRPEMTPTLARMVAARPTDYRRPLRWFSTPLCFRHERGQRGRKREFFQLNCDILGDAGLAADAELIALAVDVLRAFGFGPEDVVIRVSDRVAWAQWAAVQGLAPEGLAALLEIIDKLGRTPAEETDRRLRELGVAPETLREFLADPARQRPELGALMGELEARGLGPYVKLDLTIVRGLAYYTGVVFEIFDRTEKERAIAGGGRYDDLLAVISDGKVQLPALGFGMGDVVLGLLIDKVPAAKAKLDAWLAAQRTADVYVVVAKEERRPDALAAVQELRDAGYAVDFPLGAAKVGAQFKAAEQAGARYAVLFGDEWPLVKVKRLATREERLVGRGELLGSVGRAAVQAAQEGSDA